MHPDKGAQLLDVLAAEVAQVVAVEEKGDGAAGPRIAHDRFVRGAVAAQNLGLTHRRTMRGVPRQQYVMERYEGEKGDGGSRVRPARLGPAAARQEQSPGQAQRWKGRQDARRQLAS